MADATVLREPVKIVFDDANDVPFQPVRARILPVSAVDTYSVPSRYTRPATPPGIPGSSAAVPPGARASTPPPFPDSSLPNAPMKIVPFTVSNAKEVGVDTSLATVVTALPFAAFGGGGPWAPAAAERTSTPAVASSPERHHLDNVIKYLAGSMT